MPDRGKAPGGTVVDAAPGHRSESSALETADASKPETLAAEKRLEPGPGMNPTHATVRLLRKIGEGDWELAPLINGERGVFLYRHLPAWGEQGSLSKLHCAGTLEQAKKQLKQHFETAAQRIEMDGARFSTSCNNKPRPPRCTSWMAGEYEPTVLFLFADGARGIELDAVLELDLGQTSNEPERIAKRAMNRAQEALRTARAKGCPES